MKTIKKKTIPLKSIIASSLLPRSETELLLVFLSGKTREFILTHPEYELKTIIAKKFKVLEKKRLINWPIAYLIGSKGFYGYDFKITTNVLTPRPETEMIIDWLIDEINEESLVIDIGTGSGAIIISTALEIKEKKPLFYKTNDFYGLDISAKAILVAKINTKKYHLEKKIIFRRGNLLEPIKKEIIKASLSGKKIIIAANLPYLTLKQIKESPSISREPKIALLAGSDGLKYYRELFIWLRDYKENLLQMPHISLICEIDDLQAEKISTLAKKYFPNCSPKIKTDLNYKKRFLII